MIAMISSVGVASEARLSSLFCGPLLCICLLGSLLFGNLSSTVNGTFCLNQYRCNKTKFFSIFHNSRLTSLKSLRLRDLLTFCYLCYISLSLVLPFLALLSLTGPYWALLGLTGLYFALLCFTGPYWALLGLTGPY